MIERFWDQTFLKERAAAVREAQFDADWIAAEAQFARELSDSFHGHRLCHHARCRRARRCVGNAPTCRVTLGHGVSPAIERQLTEEIYAGLQQERRAQASRESR